MNKLTKALFALVFIGALAPCCMAEEVQVQEEEEIVTTETQEAVEAELAN